MCCLLLLCCCRDTFWLTDQRGAKLSDDLADSVAERLGSFITQCAPDQNEGSAPATEFAYGNIAVSNTAHPDRTVLTIKVCFPKYPRRARHVPTPLPYLQKQGDVTAPPRGN